MSWLSNFLSRKYIERFSRPDLQSRNRKNIYRALKAYGYNNDVEIGHQAEETLFGDVLQRHGARTMLDVGANVGHYSRRLLTMFPDAQVFAFEPLGTTFSKLSALSDDFGDRFVPVNAGVGDKAGKLELRFSDGAESHASFAVEASDVPYVENTQGEVIDVVTLDGYFAPGVNDAKIDFIKIDVEGYEYEVLRGAQELIGRHRPMALQLEFNWHHMFRGHSLYMLAAALPGYDVYQMVPGGIVPRDPKDPLSNLFMFSNFVFIRSDLPVELGHDDRSGRSGP